MQKGSKKMYRENLCETFKIKNSDKVCISDINLGNLSVMCKEDYYIVEESTSKRP